MDEHRVIISTVLVRDFHFFAQDVPLIPFQT